MSNILNLRQNKKGLQRRCFLALVWYPGCGFIFQSGSLSFLSPNACCWGWLPSCNHNLLISQKFNFFRNKQTNKQSKKESNNKQINILKVYYLMKQTKNTKQPNEKKTIFFSPKVYYFLKQTNKQTIR